MKQLRYSKQR